MLKEWREVRSGRERPAIEWGAVFRRAQGGAHHVCPLGVALFHANALIDGSSGWGPMPSAPWMLNTIRRNIARSVARLDVTSSLQGAEGGAHPFAPLMLREKHGIVLGWHPVLWPHLVPLSAHEMNPESAHPASSPFPCMVCLCPPPPPPAHPSHASESACRPSRQTSSSVGAGCEDDEPGPQAMEESGVPGEQLRTRTGSWRHCVDK